ncbi:MAG TPA: SDR family oxidoreductase [Pseudomonadales bacterium]|jgi:NAD(P)-dependent dehydrogenase (short-subunit alcohol dehydrogenase family)|nr:SDR family oxidoreductase [Pseudomonadales bacterium]
MRIDLRGLTALVTGSTRGIGFAVARGLAECGASVIVNGRREEAVAQAVADLSQRVPGASFLPACADVGRAEGVGRLFAEYPRVDILVSNAATFDWTPFFDTDDADWQRHFDINVMAGVRLARRYLPWMLEQNWGRVVLVASEAGLNIPADMIHYGVSKAAEIALARGLAELTAGTGVTVNSVLPGPTASSDAVRFLDDYARDASVPRSDAERHFVASARPSSLLGRMATVEEVANMIVYASSPLASATNGAALRVEGGILRHPG